jgi:predicted CopG family antitoxin
MVRVISISDEAYAELSRIKAGRSFTEVIRALINKKTTAGNFDEVMRFFGAINDKEASGMRKASRDFRRNFAVRGIDR